MKDEWKFYIRIFVVGVLTSCFAVCVVECIRHIL